MADKKIFIDTNILIYANFFNSPFHKDALNKLTTSQLDNELWISRQVIREFLVVKSRLLNEANKYSDQNL